MFSVNQILEELEAYGSETIKNIFLKHGAQEPLFGVKVGDLKKIQKKIKKNHELALALFETGNSDAMYLAGLIADDKKMTIENLDHWVKNAKWSMISEYTVPWVAAESNFGFEMAKKWISSEIEHIASAGWATYANLLMLVPDQELNKSEIIALIKRVEENIHSGKNRVKQTMNGFIIAAGGSVSDVTEMAIETGKRIGPVTVDMGGTACKTPYAPNYIDKIKIRGNIGKKKKTVKC